MQACNTQATRRQSAGVFQFSLCSGAVLDSRLVVRTAVVITSGTGGTGFIGVQVGLFLRFLVCFWSISGRFLVNQAPACIIETTMLQTHQHKGSAGPFLRHASVHRRASSWRKRSVLGLSSRLLPARRTLCLRSPSARRSKVARNLPAIRLLLVMYGSIFEDCLC